MNSRSKPIEITVVLLLLCEVAFCQGLQLDQARAVSKAQKAPPPLEALVERVRQAQVASRTPPNYELVREYQISGMGRNSVQSHVTAALEFSPGRNSYTIQKHDGSARGTDVVRRILDHEVDASRLKSKTSDGPALSPANYDFRYQGEVVLEGKQCYLLGLLPKRKEKELIEGQAWIDESTFEVRRIEGDLAKSPSIWIRRVHVIIAFDDVDGNWLQTNLNATADVRLFGPQTLTSNLVDFKTPEVVAEKSFETGHLSGPSAFRQH
jgi:hypothetical protein